MVMIRKGRSFIRNDEDFVENGGSFYWKWY
jgi:hypothetical protein